MNLFEVSSFYLPENRDLYQILMIKPNQLNKDFDLIIKINNFGIHRFFLVPFIDISKKILKNLKKNKNIKSIFFTFSDLLITDIFKSKSNLKFLKNWEKVNLMNIVINYDENVKNESFYFLENYYLLGSFLFFLYYLFKEVKFTAVRNKDFDSFISVTGNDVVDYGISLRSGENYTYSFDMIYFLEYYLFYFNYLNDKLEITYCPIILFDQIFQNVSSLNDLKKKFLNYSYDILKVKNNNNHKFKEFEYLKQKFYQNLKIPWKYEIDTVTNFQKFVNEVKSLKLDILNFNTIERNSSDIKLRFNKITSIKFKKLLKLFFHNLVISKMNTILYFLNVDSNYKLSEFQKFYIKKAIRILENYLFDDLSKNLTRIYKLYRDMLSLYAVTTL